MFRVVWPFVVRLFACWLVTAGVIGCFPDLAHEPTTRDASRTDAREEDSASVRPERVTTAPPPEHDAAVSVGSGIAEAPPRADSGVKTPVDAGSDADDADVAAADAGARTCEAPPSPDASTGTFIPEWAEAWAVPIGPDPHLQVQAAVDGLGNTFLNNAAPSSDTLWQDAGAPNDVLLSSVDADGNLRWIVRTMGRAPGVTALLPMEDGGAVAAFPCAGAVTPSSIRCDGEGEYTLVVARFEASGALRWSRALGAPPLLERSKLARDAADNLYLVAGRSTTEATVWSLDARGEVRWSRPAVPGEGWALSVRAGELHSVDVDGIGWSRQLRWSRRSLAGDLLGRGGFAFRDLAPESEIWGDPSGVTWAPDGDFYLTTYSIASTSAFFYRVSACGVVRWRRSFGTYNASSVYASKPMTDASSAVCVRVATSFPPPAHNPRSSTCSDYRSTTYDLLLFGSDGASGHSLLSFTRTEYDSTPVDPVVHCPSPPSLRAVSVVTRRPASALTVGRRLDATGSGSTLVRFVPPADLVCARGEQRCEGRCTNTLTNVDHCGACRHACRFTHGVARCEGGGCVLAGCEDGFADCNRDPSDGCEADLRVRRDHCGACGRACGEGPCNAGLCATSEGLMPPYASDGHEGAFAPSRDVTLRAGVHHFTSITVPASVTVRSDGDTLDLRATGDVVIRGVIDLSGSGGAGGAGEPPAATLYPGAATQGAGPGGGAPGRSYRASRECIFRDQPSPLREPGGRVWGAPYDGLAPSGGQSDCMTRSLPFSVWEAYHFTTGLTAGGGSIGRVAAADLGVFTTFVAGSGGGGGASNLTSCAQSTPGSGGGAGGGALRVASHERITVAASGRLRANGGAGGYGAGAGSGGVIYLAAPAIDVAPGAVVEAVARGVPSRPVTGLGRIRLSVDPARCALAGTIDPPARSGCALSPAGGESGYVYVGPWPR